MLRLALNSLPLGFQKIFCRLQLADHFSDFCNRCGSDFPNKWRPAPLSSDWLHAVVVIPMDLEAFGVTGGQLALGASNAPRDYNSPVFCTRQRHLGTAAREQIADRHKTVARLPTVAGLASK